MDETKAFQPVAVAVEADPENGNAMGGDLTIGAFRIDDDDTTNVERFDDEIFRDNATNHHTYFLGLCCDFRKAVLWVNGISMAAIAVSLFALVVAMNQLAQNPNFEYDDFVKNVNMDMRRSLIPVAIGETIAIAMSAIGFYGALKFKIWAVFAAALMHGISFVFAAIQFSTFDVASSLTRLVATAFFFSIRTFACSFS